jgi:hypothetical protein
MRAEEMPLQPVLRPFVDYDGIGKAQKAEQDVVVVDLRPLPIMMKITTALIQCMMRTGHGCRRARRLVVDLTAAVAITDQDINCATFGVASRTAGGGALKSK